MRVLHCSEPDGRRSKYGRNSMRLGRTKDRTIQKYLETSSKQSVLVQSKARSEERIAVLSNTITRNCSLQHTACDLYWENGVHEDQGGALPQSMPIPKFASNCTEAEFAKWTTGSTWSRCKKILRPPKRIGKLRRNQQRQRRLLNTKHTSFCSPTTRHESQRNGQKVDSAVREPPEQGVFPAGLE